MNRDTAVGFDGLTAFRTEADVAIRQAERIIAIAPTAPTTDRPRPTVNRDEPIHRDGGAVASGLKKVIGWVVGIGLILVVKACIFGGIHALSSSGSSSSYSGGTTADAPYVASADTTAPDDMATIGDNMDAVADTASATDSTSETTTADMPADTGGDDGTTLTRPETGFTPLDIAGLRYCLGEDIRIAAEKAEMDTLQFGDTDRFNRHVDAFNVTVNDYNSRCSHRTYASSDKPLAESQIATQRSALETEGRNRVE